jgi:hypothetical protein
MRRRSWSSELDTDRSTGSEYGLDPNPIHLVFEPDPDGPGDDAIGEF